MSTDLATCRKAAGLSQEELAHELGVTSKGLISGIENGAPASLRLALKIEQWSAGKVTAASICPEAAQLGATVLVGVDVGATELVHP